MLLEPAAMEAVSAACSEDAHAVLREHVDLMRRAARARDLAKWYIADYSFHRQIYRLSAIRS
jgi:DNA-binding GntR family transcriptional regulator